MKMIGPVIGSIRLSSLLKRQRFQEDFLSLSIDKDNLISYVSTIRATPEISMDRDLQ